MVPVFLNSSPEGKKLSKRRLSPVGVLQLSEDMSKTSQLSGTPVPCGILDPQSPPVRGSPSPGPSATPDTTENQNLALLQPKPEPEEHESECALFNISMLRMTFNHPFPCIFERRGYRHVAHWLKIKKTSQKMSWVSNVWCEGNPECIMT